MEVHQIRYFLAVVANRHFGRAANECNVTQPALTRAIQKLEDELGGPLLNRRPNQIELTALGRQVFPHLKQAYLETTQAKVQAKAFGTRQKTKLRIGVMCTIGPWMLAELLPLVMKQLPTLDIALTQATGHELIEALSNDEIDVAIVGLPDYPSSIETQALFREPYVIAFPRGHRFEAMVDVPVSELASEIYLERMNCEFIDFYERAYGDWKVEFRGKHESESEDWIQAMIEAGMGCAIVPKNFPLLPTIVTRNLREPTVDRAISLIYNRSRDSLVSTPANAFISIVANVGWNPC
jgi:LysR family hydrogen peroxide-inducible transcriptional activator